MQQNKSPLVSVIIPTYNSARTLETTLKSVKDQTYPNIEMIVVDNQSKDETRQIAEKYADAVYIKWPERTAQKNYGIEKAKGDYIVFIDSDMELSSNVITECVEVYENTRECGGICIPERSVWDGWLSKVRDFERSFYKGSGVESARFFKKSDVERVWWFEEDLIFFEESLLPQKITQRLDKDCQISINATINHHESRVSLYDWLKKKFYYGKSLRVYQKKVQELWIAKIAKDQISLLQRYMIFFKSSRFWSHPLLALGVLFLKTCEFWAGGLGVIFSMISK